MVQLRTDTGHLTIQPTLFTHLPNFVLNQTLLPLKKALNRYSTHENSLFKAVCPSSLKRTRLNLPDDILREFSLIYHKNQLISDKNH